MGCERAAGGGRLRRFRSRSGLTGDFKTVSKVDFETACEAFFDPFVYTLEQEKHEAELRDVLIGMTLQWNVLCVVYTLRQDDVFRIISARPATPAERRQYEEQ